MSNDKNLKNILKKLNQLGKHAEALVYLQRYLKNKKLTPNIRLELAFIYYHLGKYKKAIKVYTRLLQNETNAVRAIQFLSRIYGLTKEHDAISLAKTTFIIFPNFVMANNLAGIYEMLGEYSNAELWYKKSLRLTKKHDEKKVVTANLALLYSKSRQTAKARRYAANVLKSSLKKNLIYKSLLDTLKLEVLKSDKVKQK